MTKLFYDSYWKLYALMFLKLSIYGVQWKSEKSISNRLYETPSKDRRSIGRSSMGFIDSCTTYSLNSMTMEVDDELSIHQRGLVHVRRF